MLSAGEVDARRELLGGSADLAALARRLAEGAAPLLARLPVVPTVKALLSADGGVCPDDGTALAFDPWSPAAHRCPRCGRTFAGERHDRAWARFQHLWLAERTATLAALAALTGHARARRPRGRDPLGLRLVLLRLSQPRQRARARAGSSSPPISSRSG